MQDMRDRALQRMALVEAREADVTDTSGNGIDTNGEDSEVDSEEDEYEKRSMLRRSCGCFDVGKKNFDLLTSSGKSKWAKVTGAPTTPPNNVSASASGPKRLNYTPKSKYDHSYFDENGVYWPSTAKKRRLTPAEKAESQRLKSDKKRAIACK